MKRHIRVEPYCVLCRLTILFESQNCHLDSDQENIGSWSIDVLYCFERLLFNENSAHFYIFQDDALDVNWSNSALLCQYLEQEDAEICFNSTSCSSCNPSDTINFVHRTCFLLVRMKIPTLSLQSIGYVARRYQPIVTSDMASIACRPCSSLQTLPEDVCISTSLGLFVEQIRTRLPRELQAVVCGYVTGLFQSLSNCLRAISKLKSCNISALPKVQAVIPSRPLETCSEVDRIRVAFIDILGELTFSSLGTSDLTTFDQEIIIESRSILGIQYSLGSYGMTGLRVVYDKEHTSEWLGNGFRKWTTIRSGTDLRTLRAFYDGFKLVRLELKDADKTLNNTRRLDQPFCDDENAIASKRSRSLMIDIDEPTASILGNPRGRFVQYLDLHPGQGTDNSFTVFCTGRGCVRIRCSGNDTGPLWGTSAKGMPVTVFLAAGEKIAFIQLVIRGLKWDGRQSFTGMGPYLLVKTTLGRTLYFGTFMIFHVPMHHIFTFECETTSSVSQLIFDPTTTTFDRLNSLGVVVDPLETEADLTESSLAIPALDVFAVDPLHILRAHQNTAFLTKATLSYVKSLKIQREDDRCTGLCIEHNEGVAETLGQWDPERVDDMSSIYDSENGELRSLTFFLSETNEYGDAYVKDIVASTMLNLSPSDRVFTWSDLNSELAWWFTKSRDQIERWEGWDKSLDDVERDTSCIELSHFAL